MMNDACKCGSTCSKPPRLLADGQAPGIPTDLGDDALISASRLAAYLGIDRRTVSRWVRFGELPIPMRLGGRRCWLVGMVRQFLRERMAGAQVAADPAAKSTGEATERGPW